MRPRIEHILDSILCDDIHKVREEPDKMHTINFNEQHQ